MEDHVDGAIRELQESVREIRDGLLGCIETGETGLIAKNAAQSRDLAEIKADLVHVKKLHTDVDRLKQAEKGRTWRERTIIGGLLTAMVAAFWSLLGGK